MTSQLVVEIKVITITKLKARSDVLRKIHQPGLFFTHAKNAAS